MGVSQSGLSPDRPVPTGLILVGVVIVALILAFGAKKSADDRQQRPEPTPSVSASAR